MRYIIIKIQTVGLGIAILLFAIVLEISWDGYFAYITTGMGLVGLIMAIAGFVSKEDR